MADEDKKDKPEEITVEEQKTTHAVTPDAEVHQEQTTESVVVEKQESPNVLQAMQAQLDRIESKLPETKEESPNASIETKEEQRVLSAAESGKGERTPGGNVGHDDSTAGNEKDGESQGTRRVKSRGRYKFRGRG